MHYATSLTATGEILQTCSSTARAGLEAVGRHRDAFGPLVIEANPPPENAYRVGEEWATKPAQPSKLHSWDASAKVWVAPPVAVPALVTMRQARLAMLEAGLLTSVQNALGALPSPQREAALIEWEFASEVRRDWPIVSHLQSVLGLSGPQVDALFVRAAQL